MGVHPGFTRQGEFWRGPSGGERWQRGTVNVCNTSAFTFCVFHHRTKLGNNYKNKMFAHVMVVRKYLVLHL